MTNDSVSLSASVALCGTRESAIGAGFLTMMKSYHEARPTKSIAWRVAMMAKLKIYGLSAGGVAIVALTILHTRARLMFTRQLVWRGHKLRRRNSSH